MTVDAIDDKATLEGLNAVLEASSTWNGRDVQCVPLDDEALLVRTLAFAHLAAQKEGPLAVRKLEQEIYALGSLEEEEDGDSDPELNDPEIDSLIHLTQNLACWTSPELLKAEERVKLLLDDPTRPCELLQLNKSFFDKAVKVVRNAGRKTKKVIKKHKKALIVTAVAVAAVAVIVITAGAGTPEAVAAVAASAATPSSSSGKKRDEKDSSPPSPQQSSSSPPPPPQPIDLKPIQPSELHAWTSPSMVITPPPPLVTEKSTVPSQDVYVKPHTIVSTNPDVQSPPVLNYVLPPPINYYPINEIPPLVIHEPAARPANDLHEQSQVCYGHEEGPVLDTNQGFSNARDSQIHPIRRTPETEQISSTAIATMTPPVQTTTAVERQPLKTEGANPVNVGASGLSHLFWKTVGIVVDNTLAMGEMFNPTISIPPKEKTAKEAWEQDVVPLGHEKIDKAFSTDIKDEFDRRNDSWAKRAMDAIIYNPISYLTALGTRASTVINGFSQEAVVPSTVLKEATATGAVSKFAGEATTGNLEGQIIAREVSGEGQVVL